MKKLSRLICVTVSFLSLIISQVQAANWTKDFSDVSNWSAAEGATFVSDSNKAKLEDASDGTSAATGPQSVNLGGYTFNASTAYLMPKITVHTGDGVQTLRIDNISVNYE